MGPHQKTSIFFMKREVKSLLWVHSSPGAAITRDHRLGGSGNRESFSLGFGGWTSTPKALTDLVSPEATFSVCVTRPLLGVHAHPETFLLERHQSDWMRAPVLRLHRTLLASLKVASPNAITLGLRASTYQCGRGTIRPVTVGAVDEAGWGAGENRGIAARAEEGKMTGDEQRLTEANRTALRTVQRLEARVHDVAVCSPRCPDM